MGLSPEQIYETVCKESVAGCEYDLQIRESKSVLNYSLWDSLFENCIIGHLFFPLCSSLLLALGKGTAGFLLGACRQGICFVSVILILPMVWGMNGILYAQPIADVISAIITVFMAVHLGKELSAAKANFILEKQEN